MNVFEWFIHNFWTYMSGLSAFVLGWPPFNLVTALVLLLSLAAVLIQTILLISSARWGDRLSGLAIEELAGALAPLTGNFSFNSSGSLPYTMRWRIDAIAEDIQQELQSPAITEPMIMEAIRRAYLQAQKYAFTLPQKDHPIDDVILDIPINAYDAGGRKPMSIAYYNRVLAYLIFTLAIGIFVLYLQFVLTRLLTLAGWVEIVIWTFLSVHAALLLMDVRAARFWRSHYLRAKNLARSSVSPGPPHKILDFFVYVANSSSYRLVHGILAPGWEELVIRILFPLGVPIVSAWITLQIGLHLGWKADSLNTPITTEITILYLVVGMIYGIGRFRKWHRYKYWEVAKLERKLLRLNKVMLRSALGMQAPPANLQADYDTVCKDLWAITGIDHCKRRELELLSR